MLVIKDINTYYGENQVLNGISMEVKNDSIVTLVGRNGMGKTTIVNSIIGFSPPRSGSIHFKEKEILGLSTYQICQMGIALVPQGRRIFPSLSVEENLIVGARPPKRSRGWTLEKIYSFYPRLKERAKNKGTQLSGGEQQMLSIGRSLMTNPDLLIMDEPSEGLAPIIVQELGKFISQIKSKGVTVLLVEQNLPMALKISDYIYVVSKGKIVYQSTPNKLKNNEEILNRYIGVELMSERRK